MTHLLLNQCVAKLHLPRAKHAIPLACLALAALFTEAGCSAMRVKLGMRVDLTQIPVSSIDATLPKGPDLAPGQKSPLVVTVTQPDGKVLRTEGQGGGKVQWKDLALAAAVVKANQKGVVSLARDPRISDGKAGHVTITVPSHPDLRAELDIPFRYDVPFLSNFSGSPGMSGSSGLDGSDGTSGSPGSSDPDHPSPGGDGSSGTDGANGQDGGNGANAPPVQVLVTMHGSPNGASTLTPSAAPSSAAPLSATQPSADHPLLEVSVSFAGQQRFYLVDPQGGSLTVKADGGAAGSGGKGGRGGHGGSGGFGTPNGNSGRDGSDGRNGWDGSRGQGGLITVTYDPQAKPYLSTLRLSSQNGPAPIFRQAPVAPLW